MPEIKDDNAIRCSRCLYDETFPGIHFDDAGECNYCALHDEMDAQYPAGAEGRKQLEKMAEQVRRDGKGKDYDCIVGFSGGCDSSYMLYLLVDLGLRPLAVHFDNTWNNGFASNNIYRVTRCLNVDLETYVVDDKEIDDVYRAFVLSGVNDLDVATDLGQVAVTCRVAERYGLRWVMDGHSFRTEGVSPLGMFYMDGKYLQSVHKRYGRMKLRTLPQLTLVNFLRWSGCRGIRRHRPLYHLDYIKEDAKKFMSENFDWQWYGGHHLENKIPAFWHTFMADINGFDSRLLGCAALVRSGQMSREDGIHSLSEEVQLDPDLLHIVCVRLELSKDELFYHLTKQRVLYTEFETYRDTFKKLKPLFWLLYKMDRVPKSFYVKYCTANLDKTLEV